MLIASTCALAPAASGHGAEDQAGKFEELEQEYGDSPKYLKLTKAGWLTRHGNTHGQQEEFDEAIAAFREAIEIRRDYFPAYVSLALAYRGKEQYEQAIDAIESAPATMDFNGKELGGFEYDVYYIKMLVYAAIPDHDKGLESARQGLEVLDDPGIRERRQRAEKFGIVGPGSGSKIVELLEKYVKIRESRTSD